MVLESYTYDNFQYLYINQIKDFKSSLLEIVGKISFSDFYMHLMMNIQKLYNIKEIHEITAKQIIIIKNNHNKLKIQNNKLRTENSGLKIKIQTLKTENIGLKDQNIYSNDSRINQKYLLENEQKKQKYFIINLKNIARVEQNKNNLLL